MGEEIEAVEEIQVVNEVRILQDPRGAGFFLATLDVLDILDNLAPHIDFARQYRYVDGQWTIARIGRGVEEKTGPRSREAPFVFPAGLTPADGKGPSWGLCPRNNTSRYVRYFFRTPTQEHQRSIVCVRPEL